MFLISCKNDLKSTWLVKGRSSFYYYVVNQSKKHNVTGVSATEVRYAALRELKLCYAVVTVASNTHKNCNWRPLLPPLRYWAPGRIYVRGWGATQPQRKARQLAATWWETSDNVGTCACHRVLRTLHIWVRGSQYLLEWSIPRGGHRGEFPEHRTSVLSVLSEKMPPHLSQ